MQTLNLPLLRPVCGKRRYYSDAEAGLRLAALVAREQAAGRADSARLLRVYWCTTCQAQHLGHASWSESKTA